MWSNEIKQRAIKLRKQGYSYGQLVQTLGISKSTLFEWISPIKRNGFITLEDKKRWVKSIQHLGVAALKMRRQQKLDNLETEIKTEVSSITFTRHHMRSMLAMLYWAEGNKGRFDSLTLANTDPQLLLLFINLLRKCFNIDEKKFRLRVHLHDYHKEDEIKLYWSRLLEIPLDQFEKTHWKERNKNKHFRENSYGICFLRYHDVYLKEELVKLGLAISGKITGEKSCARSLIG